MSLLQVSRCHNPLWEQMGPTLVFHRWAGFCGATAIIFTVYVENADLSDSEKEAVTLANHINYLYALLLLAVPLTRRPNMTGALFLIGMGIFSGGCYFCALFGINGFIVFCSIGYIVLILGWLSLLF